MLDTFSIGGLLHRVECGCRRRGRRRRRRCARPVSRRGRVIAWVIGRLVRLRQHRAVRAKWFIQRREEVFLEEQGGKIGVSEGWFNDFISSRINIWIYVQTLWGMIKTRKTKGCFFVILDILGKKDVTWRHGNRNVPIALEFYEKKWLQQIEEESSRHVFFHTFFLSFGQYHLQNSI